jgi:carbon-monoxide dehydrogenase medium subunit
VQRIDVYLKPRCVEEAVHMMAMNEGAKLLSGGTDLIIQIHDWSVSPPCLVDIGGIPEISRVHEEHDEIVIGSTVTFAQLEKNDLILKYCLALAEAASQVAAPQIRNRATIGGNVGNAAVAADSIPPLMVFDAVVELASIRGIRRVPISELIIDMNKTCIQHDELITCIRIPKVQVKSAFEKIGRRKAQAISRICLAVAVTSSNNVIDNSKIAVGAAGRKAYLCPNVSDVLHGKELTGDSIRDACAVLDETVAEVLGNRPTAPYKRAIASASLERALGRLLEE